MAEQHRRQSAYTSLQVGAKDLTLMRNAFGSKGILRSSFWLDLYLEMLFSELQNVRLKCCVIFFFPFLNLMFNTLLSVVTVFAVMSVSKNTVMLFNTFYNLFLELQNCCRQNHFSREINSIQLICVYRALTRLVSSDTPNPQFSLLLHYSVQTNFSIKCFCRYSQFRELMDGLERMARGSESTN